MYVRNLIDRDEKSLIPMILVKADVGQFQLCVRDKLRRYRRSGHRSPEPRREFVRYCEMSRAELT